MKGLSCRRHCLAPSRLSQLLQQNVKLLPVPLLLGRHLIFVKRSAPLERIVEVPLSGPDVGFDSGLSPVGGARRRALERV